MAHLLHQLVYDDPELAYCVGSDFSLRTLFDPHCAEWKDTSMKQKALAFRLLIFVHGLSLKRIVEEFCKLWEKSAKTYVIADAHEGLSRIYMWAIQHDHELADKFGEIIEDTDVRSRINCALRANDCCARSSGYD